MRRNTLTFVLALALGAAVAACHAKTDESHNAPSQQHDKANASADQVATNPREIPVVNPQTDMPERGPAAAAAAETQVDLIEYQINMPKTLKAGENILAVSNGGKEPHSLEIHGTGVHAALPEPIRTTGSATTLKVNLPPGTYEAYCPIPGHKEKGMKTTITVQ
jgi:uncharacterized cupredoxin-like copper-binding protein